MADHSSDPGASGEKSEPPRVLVVEDERDLADLFTGWLADEYDVVTAYSGEEALDVFDESVDVALLDRRMPGITGDEVLAHITDTESACRTAMITAVEPDFEIVELGFDDYLVKPVFQDELHETVERLLERATYDQDVKRYFSLASKRALLRAHKTDAELAQSETYTELTDELDALGEELDRTTAEMDREDFDAAFARL